MKLTQSWAELLSLLYLNRSHWSYVSKLIWRMNFVLMSCQGCLAAWSFCTLTANFICTGTSASLGDGLHWRHFWSEDDISLWKDLLGSSGAAEWEAEWIQLCIQLLCPSWQSLYTLFEMLYFLAQAHMGTDPVIHHIPSSSYCLPVHLVVHWPY